MSVDCPFRPEYHKPMLAIRTTRLFDGERFSTGATTVLIDDGRILGVERGFPEPTEHWQLLDAGDATVLPGLIDTHVHLVADSGDGALDRVAGYTDDELDAVMTQGLRRQLAAGVTTVRDLGDRRYSALHRRDRQRSGGAPDPEPAILAAGPPLTSPGGHCHYLGGEVPDRPALARALDERIERAVDVVKVMASGGMTTPGTDVLRTQFSTDDLRFVVDRAHAAGLPVTAHAHGLPAVEQALEVGADGIEHCSCLTDKGVGLSEELLATLAASGVVVGGALGAPPVAQLAKAPPAMQELMRRAGLTPEGVKQLRLQMTDRMRRAGVRFVTGSDAGINALMSHGNLRQAASFFVQSGAEPVEALAASTSLAAGACGIGDRKGFLRKGYDADVIVVDGDLRTDIEALARVRTVVLGGTVLP